MHFRKRAGRRAFVLAATALLSCPRAPLAQAKKSYRVGLLVTSNESTARPMVGTFIDGLREKGYQVGGNLILYVKHANGDIARLPALAGELVALKPDVIVGLSPAVIALRDKTTRIPLVLLASSDPVCRRVGKEPRATGHQRHRPRQPLRPGSRQARRAVAGNHSHDFAGGASRLRAYQRGRLRAIPARSGSSRQAQKRDDRERGRAR